MCARVARPALLCGPSTSPLGAFVKLTATETALLEDLARAVDSWVKAAQAACAHPSTVAWSDHPEAWAKFAAAVKERCVDVEFQTVLAELLRGLIHSVLVTFDGGTALAETTSLTISDDRGFEFRKYLHEMWPVVAAPKEGS